MSTNKNNSPTRWQNPNEARRRLPVDPAATPMPAKGKTVDTSKPAAAPNAKPVKVGRDYIGPALAALGLKAVVADKQDLLAAVIIAQALDRFGEKMIDAAAVSQYKRAS